MLKKHLDFNDDGVVTHNLSWDDTYIREILDAAHKENKVERFGKHLAKRMGKRVACIPYPIIEKWRNEGWDASTKSATEVKERAKEEGYYFKGGI